MHPDKMVETKVIRVRPYWTSIITAVITFGWATGLTVYKAIDQYGSPGTPGPPQPQYSEEQRENIKRGADIAAEIWKKQRDEEAKQKDKED